MRSWLTPVSASKFASSWYFTTKYELNALSASCPPGRRAARNAGEYNIVLAARQSSARTPLAQADHGIELAVETGVIGHQGARTVAPSGAFGTCDLDEAWH